MLIVLKILWSSLPINCGNRTIFFLSPRILRNNSHREWVQMLYSNNKSSALMMLTSHTDTVILTEITEMRKPVWVVNDKSQECDMNLTWVHTRILSKKNTCVGCQWQITRVWHEVTRCTSLPTLSLQILNLDMYKNTEKTCVGCQWQITRHCIHFPHCHPYRDLESMYKNTEKTCVGCHHKYIKTYWERDPGVRTRKKPCWLSHKTNHKSVTWSDMMHLTSHTTHADYIYMHCHPYRDHETGVRTRILKKPCIGCQWQITRVWHEVTWSNGATWEKRGVCLTFCSLRRPLLGLAWNKRMKV